MIYTFDTDAMSHKELTDAITELHAVAAEKFRSTISNIVGKCFYDEDRDIAYCVTGTSSFVSEDETLLYCIIVNRMSDNCAYGVRFYSELKSATEISGNKFLDIWEDFMNEMDDDVRVALNRGRSKSDG